MRRFEYVCSYDIDAQHSVQRTCAGCAHTCEDSAPTADSASGDFSRQVPPRCHYPKGYCSLHPFGVQAGLLPLRGAGGDAVRGRMSRREAIPLGGPLSKN